eukprot:CAMPEP_0171490102 /NCGR_PEP_ID=MMETSP0958-20121227/3121_1 /TAXON_ID=87120 /ORGANISM="Aurantiochytrium limacinum, Strain ATCCMYA-1381" /LENGTH=260 /DNA_ID=CAMNT_0012023379 /DNA_START=605 /DNA_END=1387 /DNA_ORIENTATION=-
MAAATRTRAPLMNSGLVMKTAELMPKSRVPSGLAPRVKTFKTESSKLRNVAEAVPTASAVGASAGLGGILAFIQANPFKAQVTIATFKTSAADLIVQTRVEKNDHIDWRRNMLFVLFGTTYLGICQWFIYVRLFQYLFPAVKTFCNQPVREKIRNKAGIKALFSQIALDFTVCQPFFYFPTFYTFKTLLSSDPDVQASLSNRIAYAYHNWSTNFWQDNLGMCSFWLPMHIINFSAPVYLRLPLIHSVSFVWCCILSIFRG